MTKIGRNSKSNFKKYLDQLWATVIHLRDRTCAFCSSQKNLNAHHIFSRRHGNTRYDTRNGLLLCYSHHMWLAHSDFEKIRDLVIKKLGEKEFELLKARAYITQKQDLKAWELQLMTELKELAKIPDDWLDMSETKRLQFLTTLRNGKKETSRVDRTSKEPNY